MTKRNIGKRVTLKNTSVGDWVSWHSTGLRGQVIKINDYEGMMNPDYTVRFVDGTERSDWGVNFKTAAAPN